jgi:hypothetical protein
LFDSIYGVDFSGARLAGLNTWVARIEPAPARRRSPRYRLTCLHRLSDLCGTAERAPALAHLTRLVAESERAVWAFDFPFGLPVEIMAPGDGWLAQLDLVRAWDDGAYDLGLECVRRSLAVGGRMHIRRLTDVEERAPFDPYYYRIIYQTFHGMRDVLDPLRRRRGTAVLPFQYRRLPAASRVLVEACPASTLKRLGLPHQNYKQPEGGPLLPKRLRARRAILAGLAEHVDVSASHRRVMMRNGGGDALDALVAAVGAALAWRTSDHAEIARHPRYPREGRLYV